MQSPAFITPCVSLHLPSSSSQQSTKASDGTLLHTIHTPPLSPPATSTTILLHDFMTDSRLYTTLTPLLRTHSPKTHQISYDQRGFGKTSFTPTTYHRLSDIKSAATPHPPPYNLLATGLGAALSLQHAIHLPSETTSLALISSALPGHKWPPKSALSLSDARQAAANLASARLHGLVDDKSAPDLDLVKWKRAFLQRNDAWTDALQNAASHVTDLLVAMVKQYRGAHFFQQEFAQPGFDDEDVPLRCQLGQVDVPVLVMVGERDSTDFQQIAQEVWDGVPRAWGHAPVIVPGAGHFAALENPQFVVDTVVRFWDDVEAGNI